MTHKVYPDHLPRVKNEQSKVWEQVYKGCAQAILTQEEVEALLNVLDELYVPELPDELSGTVENAGDVIGAILCNGVDRMMKLHGVLGAFDTDKFTGFSKPATELVTGQKYREVSCDPIPELVVRNIDGKEAKAP